MDGRKVSKEIREELKRRIAVLGKKGVAPVLSGILVGEDPGSLSFVRLKEKGCEDVGIRPLMKKFPEGITQKQVMTEIKRLDDDPDVHGIFVQLPVPRHLDENLILSEVNPEKDVDGFHPLSVGRAWLNQDGFLPAAPLGMMEILRRYRYSVKDKEVVIVNVDALVGKPLASLMVRDGANVTLCQPDTPNLKRFTIRADILVVSVNRPGFINDQMVKDGVKIIDFGFSYVNGKSVGDVDFEAVKEKAGAITPVPGGVGPMTVTMLLANTVNACERQIRSR
jgi:methylenetetrahydrofolate dehydrogenase (NADP+)/methenyltetrahydrofolate cyclohydrolase